jgi:hypothetical protein
LHIANRGGDDRPGDTCGHYDGSNMLVNVAVSVASDATGSGPGFPVLKIMADPPKQQLATTIRLIRKMNGWLLMYLFMFPRLKPAYYFG